MLLPCLSWVAYVLGQLGGLLFTLKPSNTIRPLPDDVMVEILSRLPVECVLNCRRVCKRWEELTWTSHFADLHIKNMADPLVLLHCDSEFYLLYPRSRKGKKISRVKKDPDSLLSPHSTELVGSCNGLLLLRSKDDFTTTYVYNPVMQEETILRNPYRTGYVCGIYFQPLIGEYNVLYVLKQGNNSLYYTCGLTNYSGAKWRQMCSFGYQPASSSIATSAHGALHWINNAQTRKNDHDMPLCSHGILVFDISREEFCTMSHPGKECRSIRSHYRMQLLEMKQHLAFCQVDAYNKCLDIWVLEDYIKRVWVRSYIINLDWNLYLYPFGNSFALTRYDIKPLIIHNNELLLAWKSRGIFWYNLRNKKIRKMQGGWIDYNEIDSIQSNISSCRVSAYTKTLVSLKKRHNGRKS